MGHNFNDIAKDAEQGDSDAQFNLGICYFNGEGVEKDLEQAVNWFRKAAQQGSPEAQFNLAVCYNKGRGVAKDSKQAIAWFQKAAELGNANAQYALAFFYGRGILVEKDSEVEVSWLMKAAEQGFLEAQLTLGSYYRTGDSVQQDFGQAFGWYKKAAGTTTVRYGVVSAIAWNSQNCINDGTQSVAGKLPNALGLYDMLGNVWEWCQDCLGSYHYLASRPTASMPNPFGPHRLLRGGSARADSSFCRASQRNHVRPQTHGRSIGFRAVRTP